MTDELDDVIAKLRDSLARLRDQQGGQSGVREPRRNLPKDLVGAAANEIPKGEDTK